MKQDVVRSLEQAGGMRCVDILREGDQYGWVECRRDPEDHSGWKRLGPPHMAFDSEADAFSDARHTVGWLATQSTL